MLLLSNSGFEIVSWPLHLILTNLTSLTFHHDLLELFVGLKDVTTCIDGWVTRDLALRVKVIIVVVTSILLALLRDSCVRTLFTSHHSGLLIISIGILLLTSLCFLVLSIRK